MSRPAHDAPAPQAAEVADKAAHERPSSAAVHPSCQRCTAGCCEGKTPREIKRCLKRHVARRIFRLLEGPAQAA